MSEPITVPKTDLEITESVECWLQRLVIGEGLCPFAGEPYTTGRIRFVVSRAQDEETLLTDVLQELLTLRQTPWQQAETSLLILPQILADFYAYNDFLDLLDALLEQEQMEGEFQIATMHPNYQFADTDYADAQNYTNRSPYPILHLLREESLSRALAQFPHPERIPERNILHTQRLGVDTLQRLLQSCMSPGGE